MTTFTKEASKQPFYPFYWLWGVILVLLITASAAAAGETLNIGDRKQLFIDQRFMESSDNVKLTTNQPVKLGNVAYSRTYPWQHHVVFVGSIIEEAGKSRIYYSAYTPLGRSLAYAETTDGLHWMLPSLGVVEVNGSRDHGILIGDQGGACPEVATVFRDERAPSPERRYLMFMPFWNGDKSPLAKDNGIYAYQSADGFHFTKVRRVMPLISDNPANIQWDARVGKYVVFMRAHALGESNQRRIARIELDDPLQPWPYDASAPANNVGFVGIHTPRHIPVVLQADDKIDPLSDFYYNNGMIYPYAQDVYLMFITPFRHFGRQQQPFFRFEKFEQGGDFGLLETQLATSRDGIHWNRYEQWPYITTGLVDEWDRYYCVAGRGMVKHANYLYQYYISGGRTHDGGIVRAEHDDKLKNYNEAGPGVVRQRLDGFVSADVDNQGGSILTPPLVFSGKKLRLNIDAGAMGTCFIELRDGDGKPIPGFTLAEAEETGGNYIDEPVYWNGSTDVSSLSGKPVRLYFKLKRTKLYAFQFTNE